jgi:hypothetical protein
MQPNNMPFVKRKENKHISLSPRMHLNHIQELRVQKHDDGKKVAIIIQILKHRDGYIAMPLARSAHYGTRKAIMTVCAGAHAGFGDRKSGKSTNIAGWSSNGCLRAFIASGGGASSTSTNHERQAPTRRISHPN